MLLAHSEGLTQAEIARRLNVHRSTVNRYLPDLPKHIYVDDLDGGRWKIDRAAYLVNIRLNVHEAMTVHLASRLLATRSDKHNPHAAAALRKLGLALERLAPHISHHLQQSADVMDDTTQKQQPAYIQALEALTLAWAEGKKVRIWHLHQPSGEVYPYIFSPYFIEPYAIGHTSHVIGLREPPGEMRTFKLERIQEVELLQERYEIPEDFDPRDLLRDAWGIWYSEEQPFDIVLRFHPRVAPRVLETRWHSSEHTEEGEDGSLIWRAQIANSQEILPWIRSWGADVEVLAPSNLRSALRRETHRLANLYLPDQRSPDWFHLWAKASDEGFHPLLYHLTDVGQCALALWQKALAPSLRQYLADELGLSLDACASLLSSWIALHDLGKASPGFQVKRTDRISTLKSYGFDFPSLHGTSASPHGVVTTQALTQLLTEIGQMKRADARLVAHAIGGHHGLWPNTVAVQNLKTSEVGGERWTAARRALYNQLCSIFHPPLAVQLPQEIGRKNAFLTLLSGMATAADWLGSMEKYFPFEEVYLPSDQYAELSAQRAQRALQETGWTGGWQPDGQIRTFEEMFPDFQPNEVQQTVIHSAQEAVFPALVILEAPTGTGKTEAALYLADVWLQSQLGRGLYIAMPTRATSNQMYGRTLRFLDECYPLDQINIHLAHAQALWDEPAQRLEITSVGESSEDHMRAESWFLPRKRTLLAPFAVGTVDQALLSVLQARHFFLRLFGLAHKVVVFDEVHAYDTYMEHLFLRLLTWLRSVGTSVIVLSATLPETTRQNMIAAFTGKDGAAAHSVSCPRLTVASILNVKSHPIPVPESRTIRLNWTDRDPDAIAAEVRKYTEIKGCTTVVCNTVGRAQKIYEALRRKGFSAESCSLFHARMPAAWRASIEQQVLAMFGKGGRRPERAILVATQVIEQSLDLDFDLMISDLAPIDLLIQRAGRLHRHKRSQRPSGLEEPLLMLARPSGTLQDPDFGNDAYIYQRYILWQSYRALHDKEQLLLPADTAELIEFVYGDFHSSDVPPALADGLCRAHETMLKDFQHAGIEAMKRLVPEPKAERLLTDAWQDLQDDENPALHPHLRALTRLIEPGISLVCLHRMPDGSLNLEPDGSALQVDLERQPDRRVMQELLRYTVDVHHRTIVSHFSLLLPWMPWKRTSALRFAYPVIFEKGICTLDDSKYRLTLDKTLGFRILKEVP